MLSSGMIARNTVVHWPCKYMVPVRMRAARASVLRAIDFDLRSPLSSCLKDKLGTAHFVCFMSAFQPSIIAAPSSIHKSSTVTIDAGLDSGIRIPGDIEVLSDK